MRAAGLKGVTFEQAVKDIRLSGDIRQIGEGAARIAINDGLSMAEGVSRTKTKSAVDGKKKSADKSRTANTKVRPKKGAVTVSEDVKVTKSMKGDIEVLNRIAEVGDVAVVIEKFEGADKDAKGFYSKGVIHLNADKLSEGGFTYTGIHESVHYLAEANPEGYAAIEKFLRNYYKQQGVDLESEIELTKALYSERGVELTKEEAMEEIVCNTLSDIATDKKALSAFLKLSKKEQKSFVDFIRDIAKRLKAWADKNLKGSKYHSVIINDAKTLRELAGVFNTELSKSAQKNNTAENSGVKYSIKNTSRLTLKEQLRLFYDGELKSSDAFYFGITPSAIEKAGVSKLPLVFGQKDFKKSTKTKHNIPRRVLKNLSYSLSKPILSFSYDNRIGVLTSDVDADGKPVLVGLEKNVMMDREPVNAIRSIYGLDNPKEWIKNQIDSDKTVVIYNEKRANSFLQTYGYKASVEEGIELLNERISQDIEDVNKKSIASTDEEYLSAVEKGDMETAQRLVDEAADAAMKESKIRDESGNLVKVYHGSDSADFYEFDKQRRGQTDSSMYGRGYYFAFDPDYSSDFGENIREFYLDIKNPLMICKK